MSPSIPTVSVVVACYKVTEYIAEALDSVRAQTFRDFETVVINDGCPDTVNLEHALEPYRREIVYINQKNQGLSAARNAGIRAARAPLIALLDGDDAWDRDYLESQLAVFQANPGADVVYPNALCFDGISREVEYFDIFPGGREVTFLSLITRQCCVFGCATVKREALIRAGLYDVSAPAAVDLDLWLRMARTGAKFVFNPTPIYRYRSRRGSLTNDMLRMMDAELHAFRKHLPSPDLTEEERLAVENEIRRSSARAELVLAKRALYASRRDEALERFSRANKVLDSHRLRVASILLRICPKLLYTYIHRRYPTEYSYLH